MIIAIVWRRFKWTSKLDVIDGHCFYPPHWYRHCFQICLWNHPRFFAVTAFFVIIIAITFVVYRLLRCYLVIIFCRCIRYNYSLASTIHAERRPGANIWSGKAEAGAGCFCPPSANPHGHQKALQDWQIVAWKRVGELGRRRRRKLNINHSTWKNDIKVDDGLSLMLRRSMKEVVSSLHNAERSAFTLISPFLPPLL